MDYLMFYYPSYKFVVTNNISDAGNIYNHGKATEDGFIVYSVVVPIICVFGILGNTVSLLVLSRRELKGSVYVYLTVLAFVDVCSAILLFLSGLSCGTFFLHGNWPVYDVLFGLPLAIMFNTMSVFTVIMVTFDRICYLSNPLTCKKPKLCRVNLAHKIMTVCFVISVLTTIPYGFAFTIKDSEVVPRPFFYSKFYNGYNWARFFIFGVLASVFLILGNGYIIYGLKRLKNIYAKCNNTVRCKRPQNYYNLTTTLILIIFIFVLSQIPSMLINRESATTFFFSPRSINDTCNSEFLEKAREIGSVITAISLSSDFILYSMFCPAFVKVLRKLFSRKKTCQPAVRMNVFVLDKQQICGDNNKSQSIKELTTGKLLEMLEAESNRDSLPSSIYDGSCDYAEEEVVKSANRDTLITLCANRAS